MTTGTIGDRIVKSTFMHDAILADAVSSGWGIVGFYRFFTSHDKEKCYE